MNLPTKNLDIRDIIFGELYEAIAEEENVIALTADMSCISFDKIKRDFPTQVLNVGIAEQNMISVAAGLALGDRKVVCYAIAAFLVYRAFDQIRIDIGEMGLPIVLIGDGAGLTYGTDGSTHHALYDDLMMREVKGMIVHTPTKEQVAGVLKDAMVSTHPTYIRLVR